jgi:Sulfotransferase family
MVSARVIVATFAAFCFGGGIVRQFEVSLPEGATSTELRSDCGDSSFFPASNITVVHTNTQGQNLQQSQTKDRGNLGVTSNVIGTSGGDGIYRIHAGNDPSTFANKVDAKINPLAFSNKVSAPVILSNVTCKVGFVHVGKAAGSTVETAFDPLSCHRVFRRANGKVRGPTEKELAACYQQKHRDDSPFSDQVALQLHLGNPPLLMPQIKNFTTFMFTVRNPITRMISAFNYLHPNNTESTYAKQQFPEKTTFYKRCFPKVQDLFQAVDSIYYPKNPAQTIDYNVYKPPINVQSSTYCQYLALAILRAELPELRKVNVHLFHNYRYYWKYTGQKFPKKEILALRTEHMWQDIIDLDVATGGSGKFKYKGSVQRANPVPKTKTSKATREYQSMCCVLWEELDLFQKITARCMDYMWD